MIINGASKSITLGKGLLILIIAVLFTSCHKDVKKFYNQIKSQEDNIHKIAISYPLNHTLFPPDLNIPTFNWDDSIVKCDYWYVYLTDNNGNELISEKIQKAHWSPDPVIWNNIKVNFPDKNIVLSVIGVKEGLFGERLEFSNTNFSISKDSVAAPIFCRAVPLPFSYAVKNVGEIEWHIGNVGDSHTKKLLDHIPVCANCHSFPSNGSVLAMDVDYANDKGSYTLSKIDGTCKIKKEDIITWSDYRRSDGENTYGLLSQISPDGRYVVSTVKDRSVFVAIDDNFMYSQLFFPVKGILALYDRESKKFTEFNGASDKKYVQSNPSWSPDSKEIIFARNTRYSSDKIDKSSSVLLTISDAEEFISRKKDFKFSLYRLPFNEGKGGIPVPVKGASDNGKSNYFARYSPDGKWIVFCQAENFMLLQQDSRLYIMPAQGGEPRLMNCNMEQMNSWHSWSPNSKWIVFSSKNTGPYTQLYLTHIDENGNDSPPVLLENFVFDKRAANIPEFYTGKFENFEKIIDEFSTSPIYCVRNANDNIMHKEYLKAFENLEKAIDLDPRYFEAYTTRIKLNNILYQGEQNKYKDDKQIALSIINENLKKAPNDESLLIDRANLYMLNNQFHEAMADAQSVLAINGRNFKAYEIMCGGLVKLKEWNKAIEYYKRHIALNPDNLKELQCLMASSMLKTENHTQAMGIINSLIQQYPSDPELYINRALLLAETGDTGSSIKDMDKAVELSEGKNYNVYIKRSELYSYLNNNTETQNEIKKAIEVINKMITDHNDDIELIFVRADLYQRLKETDNALEDYKAILKFYPANYRALLNIARIEIEKQNWDGALKNYDILLNCYSPKPEFYINMAIANIRLKNTNKAASCFNEGLKLYPDNIDLLYNRAHFFLSINEKIRSHNDLVTASSILNEKKKKGELNKKEGMILEKINQELNQ